MLVNKQIPDQVWDDASTWESGEREEVFAEQKPPPSPETMSIVILDLIQDLHEFCTQPPSKSSIDKINELRYRTMGQRNRRLTSVFTASEVRG